MEKFIKMTFKKESDAFKASQKIGEVVNDYDISLNGIIIITKDAEGNAEINDTKGERIPFTLGGALTGSLIGVLGGPFGVIWGASLGMLAGMTGDMIRSTAIKNNLDLLVQRLDKDATYILMYSNEMWETPLNVIAEECNGTLERFDIEVVEELLEEEYEKIEQEIEEKKQALIVSAEEQEKSQLQEELDALKKKRRELGKKIQTKTEAQKKQYKNWVAKLKGKYDKWRSKAKEEIREEKFKEDIAEFKKEVREEWNELKDKLK